MSATLRVRRQAVRVMQKQHRRQGLILMYFCYCSYREKLFNICAARLSDYFNQTLNKINAQLN